eukprot:9178118-Lingulodinium_polyedra.AAC.1
MRVLVLPVTYEALRSMGHVRTISPELSRLLDQLAICRPLACRALVHKLHDIMRVCLRTRPGVLSEQTTRVWLFNEVDTSVRKLMESKHTTQNANGLALG